MAWYRLRRSGVPYFTKGTPPRGAVRISGPGDVTGADGAAGEATEGEASPADEQLLDGTIDQVVERLSDADLDTIERLLRTEHAGAARKGLLERLARMRDRLQG